MSSFIEGNRSNIIM